MADFFQKHALDHLSLPDNCKVILMCTKISDTVQGKSTADIGLDKDCSAFLDFLVMIAMTKIPTKRFNLKCYRPVEERRPRTYPIVVIMVSRTTGTVHMPLVR